MGGPGSGRWRGHRKKILAEECFAISAIELARDGFFREGIHTRFIYKTISNDKVIISPIIDDATDCLAINIIYKKTKRLIPIVSISMPNRSKWYRFKCTGLSGMNDCGRLALKLYCPPNSNIFACYMCHKLSWKSRQT
jgi:hypothetical protein